MNAVLPLQPKSAPSAAPDPAAPPKDAQEGETFSSVMERRNPSGKARITSKEPHAAECEVQDVEKPKAPRQEDPADTDDVAVPLFTLPSPLVEAPVPLSLPIGAGMQWLDMDYEGPTADPDITAGQERAQNAGSIFAGSTQGLPILSAMFPVSMAQLQAQLQVRAESVPNDIALPFKPLNPLPAGEPLPSKPGLLPEGEPLMSKPGPLALGEPQPSEAGDAPAVGALMASGRSVRTELFDEKPAPRSVADRVASPRILSTVALEDDRPMPQPPALANGEVEVSAAPVQDSARQARTIRGSTQSVDPMLLATESPTDTVTKETPVAPDEMQFQLDLEAALADPSVALRVQRRMSPESSLVDGVPPTHGTPAAKGGEVMQDVPFQAPPNPRVARSSGDRVSSLGAVESFPTTPAPVRSEFPVVAGEPTETVGRQKLDTRGGGEGKADPHAAPFAMAQPGSTMRTETEAAQSTRQPAPSAEPADVPGSEHQPGAEVQIDSSRGVSAESQTARPQVERIGSEPVSADAPISRAELVQVVERTADAAVRLRAAGSERIEVAVQLESGDHLTIQLRIANGEVTTHFRTSSEGLRTALEQNWTQFSDRASDRGVRMIQPVFDVSQSSSNMTDLSQQRHGRDTAYTDPQTELFPNLPRRMRAPRVSAVAPLESASTAPAGVRTYA